MGAMIKKVRPRAGKYLKKKKIINPNFRVKSSWLEDACVV